MSDSKVPTLDSHQIVECELENESSLSHHLNNNSQYWTTLVLLAEARLDYWPRRTSVFRVVSQLVRGRSPVLASCCGTTLSRDAMRRSCRWRHLRTRCGSSVEWACARALQIRAEISSDVIENIQCSVEWLTVALRSVFEAEGQGHRCVVLEELRGETIPPQVVGFLQPNRKFNTPWKTPARNQINRSSWRNLRAVLKTSVEFMDLVVRLTNERRLTSEKNVKIISWTNAWTKSKLKIYTEQ